MTKERELLQECLKYLDDGALVWEIRAALAAQPSREGWIPVSERLPEPNGQLIVIRWNNETEHHICDRYELVEYEGSVGWSYATHWMPLPAAPKGDE